MKTITGYMENMLKCVSKNEPILLSILYRPKGGETVVRLYYIYYYKTGTNTQQKYTVSLQELWENYVFWYRTVLERTHSNTFTVIHKYSIQEIYSCIIHYSEQRKETEESCKLHGDNYGTPQRLRKIRKRDDGPLAGYRSQNNANRSWKEGRLLCLFFVVILLSMKNIVFRILQYYHCILVV